MMLAAIRPELFGPIIVAGSPLSYWAGVHGKNPMRYSGGLLGGSWLTALTGDLGHGKFDGAWLVQNFENQNPANTSASRASSRDRATRARLRSRARHGRITSQNRTLRCAASIINSMAGANIPSGDADEAPIEDGCASLDGIVLFLRFPRLSMPKNGVSALH
jgi:hypothetical protein